MYPYNKFYILFINSENLIKIYQTMKPFNHHKLCNKNTDIKTSKVVCVKSILHKNIY